MNVLYVVIGKGIFFYIKTTHSYFYKRDKLEKVA